MKNRPPFIEKLYNKITAIETAKIEKEVKALQEQINALQASLKNRIDASMQTQLAKLVEMGALDEDEAAEIAKEYGIMPKKKAARSPSPNTGDGCGRGVSIGRGC